MINKDQLQIYKESLLVKTKWGAQQVWLLKHQNKENANNHREQDSAFSNSALGTILTIQ